MRYGSTPSTPRGSGPGGGRPARNQSCATWLGFSHIFLRAAILAVLLTPAACGRMPVTAGKPAGQPAGLPAATVTAVIRPTATEAGLDPACLQGDWQVSNMDRTLAESIGRSGSPFEVEKVGGAAIYHFSPEGLLEITFESLEVRLRGDVEGEEMRASNRLEGSAVAEFRVNRLEQQIELSDFGGDGIFFRLELNGQLLSEGDFPTWQAFTAALNGGTQAPSAPEMPTRVVERARAAVHCTAETLAIQTLDPLPGPRIELRRLEKDSSP